MTAIYQLIKESNSGQLDRRPQTATYKSSYTTKSYLQIGFIFRCYLCKSSTCFEKIQFEI